MKILNTKMTSNTNLRFHTFDIKQIQELFTILETQDFTIGDMLSDLLVMYKLRINEGPSGDLDRECFKRVMAANSLIECKRECKRFLEKAELQQGLEPQRPKNPTTMEKLLTRRKGKKTIFNVSSIY